MKQFTVLLVVLLSFNTFAVAQKDKDDNKLTAQEVIDKHLASIGTPEALAAAKTRVMVGMGTLTSRSGYAGTLTGPAQFASDSRRVVFALVLNSKDYPYEKVGYDGDSLTTGLYQGAPSVLAEFLKSNRAIVKKGLFGGTASSAWMILRKDNDAKFEYKGTTKIGNVVAHRLILVTSGLDGMSVTMFFEDQTFRHLRTVYRRRTSELIGPNPSRPTMIGGAPQDYVMTEDFSSFAKAGDLVVPLKYTIDVSSETATRSLTWTINFAEVYYNEQLADSVFKVS